MARTNPQDRQRPHYQFQRADQLSGKGAQAIFRNQDQCVASVIVQERVCSSKLIMTPKTSRSSSTVCLVAGEAENKADAGRQRV